MLAVCGLDVKWTAATTAATEDIQVFQENQMPTEKDATMYCDKKQ